MPASQAFVLMNLDLIAVPLQVNGGTFTVYCGSRRALQLLGGMEVGVGRSLSRRFACANSGHMVDQSSGNISLRVTAPSVAFSMGAPK